MNPCKKHLKFKGDVCPVCLKEQVKKLEEAFGELKHIVDMIDVEYMRPQILERMTEIIQNASEQEVDV